jgi:hypothetical protein
VAVNVPGAPVGRSAVAGEPGMGMRGLVWWRREGGGKEGVVGGISEKPAKERAPRKTSIHFWYRHLICNTIKGKKNNANEQI